MNIVHRTDSSGSKAPALERRVLEAPASRDHPVEAGASELEDSGDRRPWLA